VKGAKQFLGRGEMGARLLAFDWSTTPLGALESWESSLITAVGLCLNNPLPACIWWGAELIAIHNDGYAAMLADIPGDPFAQPARKFWADIWPTIGDEVEAVMKYGEPVTRERVRFETTTEGHSREVFITYAYGPIFGESGEVSGMLQVCSDDTARVVAEREMERLADQRQLALDAAGMGWWRYDPISKLAEYDRRYAEIFGITGTSRPNDEILALIHPDDLPDLWAAVEASLKPTEPQPYAAEYRVLRTDGETRWVEAHGIATFGTQNGERIATGFVGTVADISARKAAEESLKRNEALLRQSEVAIRRSNATLENRVRTRTKELEEAVRELEGFTYSIAHDLRAPLRNIIGRVNIIEEDFGTEIPTEALENLTGIERSAMALGRLVDDLLEFSRLGRREASRVLLDFTELAESVVASLPAELSAKGEVKIERRMQALGDRALLAMVLDNLIGNALKYSKKTAPNLVEVGCASDAGESIVYFVRDQGIGFPQEFAEKTFLPFERLHRRSEYPGSGIGLANVRRIVEKHRGRVWAESAENEGATFYFTLG